MADSYSLSRRSAPWPADPAVSFPSHCPSHPTLPLASGTWSPHTPTPTTEKIGELSLALGQQIHTLSPFPHPGPDPAATKRRGPASPLRLRSSVKRPVEAKKEQRHGVGLSGPPTRSSRSCCPPGRKKGLPRPECLPLTGLFGVPGLTGPMRARLGQAEPACLSWRCVRGPGSQKVPQCLGKFH